MDSTPTPGPRPLLGWAALDSAEHGQVVMVVGDLPEYAKFSGDPETAHFVSDTYGGAWFGASLDGEPTIAFGLVDLNDAEAPPLLWYFASPPPEVVSRAMTEHHLVAVIPSDAPGVEAFGRDTEASLALIADATVVEVAHQPQSLLRLRASYEADTASDTADLIDITDSPAVKAALAPVRSRVARATGEMLADSQLVPMAWRPWHYDLVEKEHIAGLLWQWPVIQTYFGLADPATVSLDNLAPPTPQQERKLRAYLATVTRLARSMAINSKGSVKTKWTPNSGFGPVEVEAPHDDALVALLPTLRLLFDSNEGSDLSFNQTLGALSRAANDAALSEVVHELKRWRKAHTQLRRCHVAALRHELAEELAGESLGTPHRASLADAPEISSEELILTFMYGEALHHDDDKAARIEEWDRDALLGPLMRQEVRADAGGFVHFYGAFADYVERWLKAS